MTAHHPIAATGLITADASKVTPQQFLDTLGIRSPEKRASDRAIMLADCKRAIERGDVYGFPPAMVDECKVAMRADALIAQRFEEDMALTGPVVSAFGMGGR